VNLLSRRGEDKAFQMTDNEANTPHLSTKMAAADNACRMQQQLLLAGNDFSCQQQGSHG
jgi:hypothetical protein